MTTLAVLVVALLTDRVFGDPPRLWLSVPHPIVLIGRAVAWFDARLNDLGLTFGARRARGVLATLLIVLGAAAVGWVGERVFDRIPLGLAIEAIVVAVFLAHKSLIDHVTAVEHALAEDGLEAGRRAVSKIVGRDVTVLDEAGVTRAAIESAAENFSDGVVAPAFWFALLGLPGLLVFKVVNTANSMIGHRSPRHEAFGWAAARLDDVMNFVPARLSVPLIAAAAFLSGPSASGAFRAALADGPKHKSPNAGWPEAALAGALGLAIGGPRRYGAVAVDGAWLNPAGRRDAGPGDIRAAIRLIDVAWMILAVAVALAALILFAFAR